jgi:spoIIIJ-associated protein
MDRDALHVEAEAASLEAAVDQALAQLDCTRAEVDIKVLQAHATGLLGLFGRRNARVAVRIDNRGVIARQMTRRLLALSGLEARVSVSVSSQQISLSVQTEDSSLLIGRHGQTLDALQTLVSSMTDRQSTDRTSIVIDVDGYRQRRHTFLSDLAKRMTKQVLRTEKKALSPALSSGERRILYALLKTESDLESHSIRRDGGRKAVVLVPQRDG